jgi:hypothetical protein
MRETQIDINDSRRVALGFALRMAMPGDAGARRRFFFGPRIHTKKHELQVRHA